MSVSLSVGPLDVIKHLSDITITELPNTVTFECELNKENLVVDWFRDGHPYEGKKYKSDSVGTKYMLRITDLTDEDHAEFSIRYRNVEYSKANLKIQGELF